MTAGVDIRVQGHAGRITLTRPDALNAMTYDMCMAIDAALRLWRDDQGVRMVLIDALGDKAFCAGGDIAELYATGRAGDFAYARRFWRDEYRMNAMIARYPKPTLSFMQGFTMGGGVGLGCHCTWRIVAESSRIAMPECGIGLVPDVGGSHILNQINARQPGYGTWIGTTGLRLGPTDAICGFASHYLPQDLWADHKTRAIEQGETKLSKLPGTGPGTGPDPGRDTTTDFMAMAAHFNQATPVDILDSLKSDPSDAAQTAIKALTRACPLSVACHIEILRRLGPDDTIEQALKLEYRFTYRAIEQGDFLEGIRAQIIDKDRTPRWTHASLADVSQADVEAMLAPLGDDELTFDA